MSRSAVVLCRTISASGLASARPSTATPTTCTTARGSQPPRHRTPATITSSRTAARVTSTTTTNSRSRVIPKASTYRSIRRSADATTPRVPTQRTPSAAREIIRSRSDSRGARRAATATTARVSAVATTSCANPSARTARRSDPPSPGCARARRPARRPGRARRPGPWHPGRAQAAATRRDARVGPAPGRPARRGEWLLPVLALDAMVLAFVLVQVGGLVDGHAHILETVGLTYAQYAREGFAQLVVATALTLAVVAVAARRAPRESERDRMISRAALGVLCVGTLGVVASALRRMDLYVEAFGMTRLRLFVVVVEVTLAAVLLLVMVAGVRWRGGWLPRAVVQVVGVAVLGLALANPDALIVRHNT